MIVLHPGDSIHLTLWFNEHKQTQEEAYAAVKPIFDGNGIHIWSWTAVSGTSPFPMQVIAFRKP
jgi:hypothetical protein